MKNYGLVDTANIVSIVYNPVLCYVNVFLMKIICVLPKLATKDIQAQFVKMN